jgi:hypothetical protein
MGAISVEKYDPIKSESISVSNSIPHKMETKLNPLIHPDLHSNIPGLN